MSNSKALQRVAELACLAVLETSRNGAPTAYVRRGLLNDVEDALIEAGYNMVAARARYRAIRKAERAASKAKMDTAALARVPIGTRVEVSLYSGARDHRLEKGTVAGPGKRDMVLVRWDEGGEQSLVSAHDLDLLRPEVKG